MVAPCICREKRRRCCLCTFFCKSQRVHKPSKDYLPGRRATCTHSYRHKLVRSICMPFIFTNSFFRTVQPCDEWVLSLTCQNLRFWKGVSLTLCKKVCAAYLSKISCKLLGRYSFEVVVCSSCCCFYCACKSVLASVLTEHM